MTPYKIEGLGVLPGGTSCTPNAINHRGHVVGTADTVGNWAQAFLWTEATGMSALPNLPGATHSSANDINNHGDIVGSCSIWDPVQEENIFYATHWIAGVPNNLDQNAWADAQSININGEISGGKYDTNTRQNFACSWKGGVIQLLELASYHGSEQNVQCNGLCIIDSGEVFGTILKDRPNPPPYNEYEAALKWNNAGNVQELDYPNNLDIEGLGGRDSDLGSANNSGVAVGSIFYGSTLANEVFKPFFWSPYGKGLLGTTSPQQKGTANHINSAGQAVGYLDDGTGQRATIWNGPVITDLNDLISPFSGWNLINATSINDAGQIVGVGFFLGELRGFIMTPVYKIIEIPHIYKLPPIYWQITFGFLGDTDGIHIVGPGGGGPGPGADTLSSLLHQIPEELRAEIRIILLSQKDIQGRRINTR